MHRTKSDKKVCLRFSAAERTALLEVKVIPSKFKKAIRAAAEVEPIAVTPDEAFRLTGYVTVEAKLAKDKQRRKLFDVMSGKIHQAICAYTDEFLANPTEAKTVQRREPVGRRKSARRTAVNADRLYQFKITLLGIDPPIWRRIQVKDCTLDELHEHIQTAMGWTNSHLHDFEIKGKRYGDPELIDDGFMDFECVDSTCTKISDIVPKNGKRFGFKYEYDFGDSWEHEVLFEGCPAVDPKASYPLCLEGARACPPEDVGGVWGYSDFLEALADPKHEQHDEFVEWAGRFKPEAFNAKKATTAMKKGLPDWRSMR